MTNTTNNGRWLAFSGTEMIAEGSLPAVATAAKKSVDAGEVGTVQFFEAATSKRLDVDLRGDLNAVLASLAPDEPSDEPQPVARRPGRPRLGVVSREVTLLPRHWEWLSRQPGGASVTLRKLIESARRGDTDSVELRGARDRLYAFMSPVAGDLPGFEEASRALFAGEGVRFGELIESWPQDVRRHLIRLGTDAFPAGG